MGEWWDVPLPGMAGDDGAVPGAEERRRTILDQRVKTWALIQGTASEVLAGREDEYRAAKEINAAISWLVASLTMEA